MSRKNMEEEAAEKIPYDLGVMAKLFGIEKDLHCSTLEAWMHAKYTLTTSERTMLKALHAEVEEDADYWNEEEMKIKGVGEMFRLAKVQLSGKIKVFYERALKGTVDGHYLSVVTDCLVATPAAFNTPEAPYFFLQEFKKRKGEKNDPEAQMLQAMLLAQEMNRDNQPVYGGFLIGSVWNFTTLTGRRYCVSRNFSTTHYEDLRQLIFILRHLQHLILHR